MSTSTRGGANLWGGTGTGEIAILDQEIMNKISSQIKQLHTSRTMDYRHTRQDRWIQTELAFTLAKNVTKPNPFEIIPIQTTRKENNWKTEEALTRAAVTVETERIKGSNPWCLWWWWWWVKVRFPMQRSVSFPFFVTITKDTVSKKSTSRCWCVSLGSYLTNSAYRHSTALSN